MDKQKRLYLLVGGLVFATVLLVMIFISAREETVDIDEERTEEFQCGEKLSHEGEEYQTVEIGNQCWMAENLRTETYRDGEEIPHIESHGEWAADNLGGYACYDNRDENCTEHGFLYNFYAVESIHGLCPDGWSVPDSSQWTELEREICEEIGNDNCEEEFTYNEEDMGWKGTNEGSHLKVKEIGGENTFDFNARFSGFRNANGPFSYLRERGFWWTNTSDDEYAQARFVGIRHEGVRRIESLKSSGFSVRCVLK